MNTWVTVAKVTGPHGVTGWVKLLSLSDIPGRITPGQRLFTPSRKSVPPPPLVIDQVKGEGSRLIVKFREIDSRNAAEALRGKTLSIPESEVPPIEEEDTYYFFQLEGMAVHDESGTLIGHIETVYEGAGNDFYGVRENGTNKEYFVPALRQAIKSVDVTAKIMIIDREWMT